MSAHVAPIRAITTPLRSSAAPPIPPPSQLYEPLAKAVLRRRLARRIFPWTLGVAMFATACLWFVVGDTRTGKGGHRAGHQGGSSMGVGARLLGAGLALWVGGVLPLVLLRKAWLTVTHTSAPSPLLLLQKSLAPPLRSRTVAALQVHVFAALWVLAVHATLLDGGVPVFIKSRKHPYTPHPALALLAFSQAVLAALYVLRAVLRDVWVFPFRPTPPHPTPASILAPLALALLAPFAALVILFVGLPLVKAVPGVSTLLHPFLPPRPRFSVLRFVPRAWGLAAATAAAWEAAGGVWGGAWGVGEPLHTTPAVRALVSGISVAATPAPEPSASGSASGFASTAGSVFSTPLRSGSSSSSSSSTTSFFAPAPAPSPPSSASPPTAEPTIYTHLAYAELLLLASSPSPGAVKVRSEEIFDVEGRVWGRLVREALILVGREYQVLLGRGSPSTAPSATPSQSAPGSTLAAVQEGAGEGGKVTPSPLLKKNIFAAPKGPASPGARVSAALASGGALETLIAPDSASASASTPSKPAAASHAPQRTQTQTSTQPPKWQLRPLLAAVLPLVSLPVVAIPPWARNFVEGAIGISMNLTLPRGWTERRAGRAAAGWVPRREVCVEAIGVLTHLICASLTEDRFGVVQRDIPRILEALLTFLAAVEEAQAGLRPAVPEMPQEEKEVLEFLGRVEEVAAAASAQAEGQADVGGTGHGNTNASGKKKVMSEEEQERMRERAREAAHLEEARGVLGEVGDALKDGIARIVRTFGDKLRAFRFAPRTAARLQRFVEYCA